MERKLLTFELTEDKKKVQIHGNKQGLLDLIEYLNKVIEYNDHEHLATESWAGAELTEEVQGKSNSIINQVDVYIWSEDKKVSD